MSRIEETKKLNILLIEDNPGDAKLFEIYLREAFFKNFHLDIADRLFSGLEKIKQIEYDIVVLDLSLPDSSGLETFSSIFNLEKDLPIVVLTGSNDEIGLNAVKHGAQDFLVKNDLNSNMLKRSIEYAIERQALNTELAERTKKLELNEKGLKEAQRIAHLCNWDWDVESNKITCSEEFYNIYNIEKENFNHTVDEIMVQVHPADREYVQRVFDKAISTHQSFSFKHRLLSSNLQVRNIYVRGDVIEATEVTPLRLVGTSQDITEREREEEMQKLAMVVTTSYNSVSISDASGNVEWVNEGFTNLSGYTLEDIKENLPKTHKKSTCYEDRDKYFEELNKTKKPIAFECRNYTKSGKEYWVITTLSPMLNSEGEVEKVVAIELDISLRKQIEEELRKANKVAKDSLNRANKALEQLKIAKKQVEETARAKEKFLANMSHEIRTPMNGIIGLTGVLLNSSITSEQKEYLTAIKNSGDTLLVVINDILDISKMEAGKMTFEKIPFKLTDITDSIVDLFYPKAKEKNVEISKQVEDNVPRVLIGDPARLNQIIMNLIGNSVKFTKRGKVVLHVEMVDEDDTSSTLEFRVIDTGRGIPKNKLKTIFQDFTQVSAEISRKYGGTGLGLAITKKLVELQGGEVKVESKVNVGSTFSFQLKFDKFTGDESSFIDEEEDENPNATSCGLEDTRVLVVEDNPVNQMLADKLLTDWGCIVDMADNGKVAINKLNKNTYDIVLMDIKMPEMDGYEATRYIREKMPSPICNVPILAATAHAATWEAEKCIHAGMNGYISKPFDTKELCEKINRLSGASSPKKQSRVKKETPLQPPISERADKRYTDLTYLRTISRGSNEFIVKMIETFLAQAKVDIENLKKHLNDENWEALSFSAHKMKPSFHFVGIEELKETIIDIEKNARERTNLSEIKGMIEKVGAIFDIAVKELNEELDKLTG